MLTLLKITLDFATDELYITEYLDCDVIKLFHLRNNSELVN